MKNLLPIVILFAITACRTIPAPPVVVTAKDSTRVEVKYQQIIVHDTVFVQLPPQSVEKTTYDSTSYLKNDYAHSTARINADGSLYHDLKLFDTQIPIAVDHPIERYDSIVYVEKEIPAPYEVPVYINKPLTSWQRFKMTVFWIVMCLFVVKLCLRWRKPLINLFQKILP